MDFYSNMQQFEKYDIIMAPHLIIHFTPNTDVKQQLEESAPLLLLFINIYFHDLVTALHSGLA